VVDRGLAEPVSRVAAALVVDRIIVQIAAELNTYAAGKHRERMNFAACRPGQCG